MCVLQHSGGIGEEEVHQQREKGPEFSAAFIANEEPVDQREDRYHPQMVVLELSRAIWTEEADLRVISKWKLKIR